MNAKKILRLEESTRETKHRDSITQAYENPWTLGNKFRVTRLGNTQTYKRAASPWGRYASSRRTSRQQNVRMSGVSGERYVQCLVFSLRARSKSSFRNDSAPGSRIRSGLILVWKRIAGKEGRMPFRSSCGPLQISLNGKMGGEGGKGLEPDGNRQRRGDQRRRQRAR
ncbi:uncharacterized protein LOC128877083 [Hylaeus volcanicus]|uniref:uncharacterized protein LOC128877083 n=1 Tax=Hylaeus volcanicus TaxID=313075 RepID=UPI0023B880A2|nr:uncharacterized protein LOC128877083 [Hylaeus volcanicus]